MPSTALLIIDLQNDFCAGGPLSVPDAEQIIGPVNAAVRDFLRRSAAVIATQDWHPADHASFASQHPQPDPENPQTLWPDHCIAGTRGAEFHPDFDSVPVQAVIRKGFRREIDSYSAFLENDRRTPTGLQGLLRALGVETVFLCGLATDYCVLYSAIDAAAMGFQTNILWDLCRPIGPPEQVRPAIEQRGITITNYR